MSWVLQSTPVFLFSLAANLALILALLSPSSFSSSADDVLCMRVAPYEAAETPLAPSALPVSAAAAAAAASQDDHQPVVPMMPLPPYPKIAERRMLVNHTAAVAISGLAFVAPPGESLPLDKDECERNCSLTAACVAWSFYSLPMQPPVCVRNLKPENAMLAMVDGAVLVTAAQRDFALWVHENAPALLAERRLLVVNWATRTTSIDLLRYITAHGLQLPSDVDVAFASMHNAHTWCPANALGPGLGYASFVALAAALPGYGGYLVTNSNATVLWARLPSPQTSWTALRPGASALRESAVRGPGVEERVAKALAAMQQLKNAPPSAAEGAETFYVAAADVPLALAAARALAEHGVPDAAAVPVMGSVLRARNLAAAAPDFAQSKPASAVVRPTPITEPHVREWLMTKLGGEGWPMPLPGAGPW